MTSVLLSTLPNRMRLPGHHTQEPPSDPRILHRSQSVHPARTRVNTISNRVPLER